VSCPSVTYCAIVGPLTIMSWSGHRWSLQSATSPPATASAVACYSVSNSHRHIPQPVVCRPLERADVDVANSAQPARLAGAKRRRRQPSGVPIATCLHRGQPRCKRQCVRPRPQVLTPSTARGCIARCARIQMKAAAGARIGGQLVRATRERPLKPGGRRLLRDGVSC
jgi:hypothetical protein